MASDVEEAIRGVFLEAPIGTLDEVNLRGLVGELIALNCHSVVGKLVAEGKKKRAGGGLVDLVAELRMALALTRHLGVAVDFNSGDNADLRFLSGPVDCLVEVKHERATYPWSELFNPDPVDISEMEAGEEWKRPGYRLHDVVRDLPVEVQPQLGSFFLKDEYLGPERAEQQRACGEVASWLADNLPEAVHRGETLLVHPIRPARFRLKIRPGSRGRISKEVGTQAWFGGGPPLRRSILKKSLKAQRRLDGTHANAYVIGMVISPVVPSTGEELLDALLGAHVANLDGDSFRSVPPRFSEQYQYAKRQGRDALLDAAELVVMNGDGAEYGLYLDTEMSGVAAVLALYCTGHFQFVPNPFAAVDINPLRRLFPSHLSLFRPGDEAPADVFARPSF